MIAKFGIIYNRLVRWTDTNVLAQKEDNPIRHFDFSPLFRVALGFDQIADLMDRVLETDGTSTAYPAL